MPIYSFLPTIYNIGTGKFEKWRCQQILEMSKLVYL